MMKILFVCVENACRSQMAEGKNNAFSAGLAGRGKSFGNRSYGRDRPEAKIDRY